MNREIRVGDIVRITPDRNQLMSMQTGWVEQLYPYAGRLVRVTEVFTNGREKSVAVVPLELDEKLGILEKRSGVDAGAGWWFDIECVELVEESDETA